MGRVMWNSQLYFPNLELNLLISSVRNVGNNPAVLSVAGSLSSVKPQAILKWRLVVDVLSIVYFHQCFEIVVGISPAIRSCYLTC